MARPPHESRGTTTSNPGDSLSGGAGFDLNTASSRLDFIHGQSAAIIIKDSRIQRQLSNLISESKKVQAGGDFSQKSFEASVRKLLRLSKDFRNKGEQRAQKSYEDGSIGHSQLLSQRLSLQSYHEEVCARVAVETKIVQEFIQNKTTVHLNDLTDEERWAALDQFAADNPGAAVSEYAKELFSERLQSKQTNPAIASAPLGRATMPTDAPAHWATDKQPGDTPASFIQRHYQPWIGRGLSRPDIRRLDPVLYGALNNWLRNNTLPPTLDLPTLKERNDRWVEQIASEGRPPMGDLTAREASRIRTMISRRGGKQQRGE